MERWTNLEYIEEEMKKRTLGKEKAGSTRGNRKDQKHIQERAVTWKPKEKNSNKRDLINDKYFREIIIEKQCLPYQSILLKMD